MQQIRSKHPFCDQSKEFPQFLSEDLFLVLPGAVARTTIHPVIFSGGNLVKYYFHPPSSPSSRTTGPQRGCGSIDNTE